MRSSLLGKCIGGYVIFALLAMFIAAILGSQLITNILISNHAERYYRETHILAAQSAPMYYSGETSRSVFARSLRIIADAENADIRLISPEGEVQIDTSVSELPYTIEHFNYADFGPKYYELSTFFGVYASQHLTVMVPVTSGFITKGYLALSTSVTDIAEKASVLTGVLYLVTFINLLLACAVLIGFLIYAQRQIGELTKGAREFASGNLSHKISVSSRDEMGELADSMNYMAAQLKKSGDYQKEFISNISHDFRSPLTSIKGFTEAMIDGTIPPELYEKYLTTISRESDRLVKLTREIMTLNSMDSTKLILHMTDFDINSMLKNTAAVFEGSCRKKKISIHLMLSGESLGVTADQERIEQVVYNLLDNAVKFSDRGTSITIETTEKYGKCYVSVKDEGCGISGEALPHIWERFYKEDTSRGKDRTGTGLGLAIVKEIISAHGQNVNVISTENVGTEFIFTLALKKQRQ
ncbi:MAG: HAMP domain-containing sensor histidine kinase [Lachnospiraceae bacterium]|nr:HAMP domain-containing sensor histidine kinase [Lachnospiraceae bacterium]